MPLSEMGKWCLLRSIATPDALSIMINFSSTVILVSLFARKNIVISKIKQKNVPFCQ
jgi:hypothetical protein